MTFGQRLKDLRTINGLTQQELADRAHIARSTLGMYEKDRRHPDFEALDQLADFFDVSLDYLLGKSDINTGYPRHNIDDMELDLYITKDADGFRRFIAYAYLINAYEKASPDTQAAVRAILHVEEPKDGDR